jgi:hypothetical protein
VGLADASDLVSPTQRAAELFSESLESFNPTVAGRCVSRFKSGSFVALVIFIFPINLHHQFIMCLYRAMQPCKICKADGHEAMVETAEFFPLVMATEVECQGLTPGCRASETRI